MHWKACNFRWNVFHRPLSVFFIVCPVITTGTNFKQWLRNDLVRWPEVIFLQSPVNGSTRESKIQRRLGSFKWIRVLWIFIAIIPTQFFWQLYRRNITAEVEIGQWQRNVQKKILKNCDLWTISGFSCFPNSIHLPLIFFTVNCILSFWMCFRLTTCITRNLGFMIKKNSLLIFPISRFDGGRKKWGRLRLHLTK